MKLSGPEINVHDYKKDKYTAYCEILYDEGNGGFHYKVNFYDYATSKLVEKMGGTEASLAEAKASAQSLAIEKFEKFRRY